VAAAAQRLDSTDIPDGDKAGVREHLALHYEQFGETPPWASQTPTKRAAERALRDAGFSQVSAKAFIARAWSEPEAEAETTGMVAGPSDLARRRFALETQIHGV
jgi:hypothetical protein